MAETSVPWAAEGTGMGSRPERKIDIDGGLDQLSRAELRALWTQEFGDKTPASLERDVLALGIAYARQDEFKAG
jgi:hypothetical protein